VDEKMRQEIALHRWAVTAGAANGKLTAGERGAVVRAIAAREHALPDGTMRRYSRNTIDRWLRAWRGGGLDGLRPSPRSDTGKVRAMPELYGEAAALRMEMPGRSAAQIASILQYRHGVRVADRTIRGQLRRAGLHRAALKAAPRAYGRYEAERPDERWVTDVLVGPWVPFPRRDGSVRARLFLIAGFSGRGAVSDDADLGDYVVDMYATPRAGWSERGFAGAGERRRRIVSEDAGGDAGSGGVIRWADVAGSCFGVVVAVFQEPVDRGVADDERGAVVVLPRPRSVTSSPQKSRTQVPSRIAG